MNNRVKRLVLIASVALAVFIGWLIYREFFTFYLKDTSPSTSSVSSVSPYIKLTFNKSVADTSKKLALTDDAGIERFVTQTIEGKIITVMLPAMNIDETYHLKSENIVSTDGKRMSIDLTFTAKDIPFDKLDKAQQEELLRLQDVSSANDVQDPIAAHLPHNTLTYNLNTFVKSSSGSDILGETLSLRAEVLLSAADVNTGADAAIERAKIDIATYIRSLGLDPASYQIEYTTRQL